MPCFANEARFAGGLVSVRVRVGIWVGHTVFERVVVVSVLKPDDDEAVECFAMNLAGSAVRLCRGLRSTDIAGPSRSVHSRDLG